MCIGSEKEMYDLMSTISVSRTSWGSSTFLGTGEEGRERGWLAVRQRHTVQICCGVGKGRDAAG